MDNLNLHKMKPVKALIEAAPGDADLPANLQPRAQSIEMWWADMKRELRTLAINVESELRRAAQRLRPALPLGKITGWFRKAMREARLN